jgi:hypothetical protein
MLGRLLSNLRRQWLGTSLGMLALFVALGGVVLAQGGDPNRVRACVFNEAPPSEPNVRIIGENESCPVRSTPRDWAIQGPQGPKGDTGERGEAGPPPAVLSSDPPSFKELASAVNFSLKGYKVLKKSTPTNNGRLKEVQTKDCDKPYPNVVTGGYETEGVPAGRSDFHLLMNELLDVAPVFGADDVWRVVAIWGGGTPWRLTAYIVCKK